ncbi:hypothetical protein Glove_9g38 [Diversispora epigaea]|uniref:Uncharacterized protein n=1 Tax=Diversispora epigaea TaxID=1348612 RepID=A0A397JN96_9GLOM|nr:hypothetical protein Glove_9g38 [Diversispora epigaea]
MENHYLAYVRWYKKIKNRFYFGINQEQMCNVELWDTEFYPKSRDCIIPVHHILGRFVPVKYKISDRKNAKEYLAQENMMIENSFQEYFNDNQDQESDNNQDQRFNDDQDQEFNNDQNQEYQEYFNDNLNQEYQEYSNNNLNQEYQEYSNNDFDQEY